MKKRATHDTIRAYGNSYANTEVKGLVEIDGDKDGYGKTSIENIDF